jgi:hypothetical protein
VFINAYTISQRKLCAVTFQKKEIFSVACTQWMVVFVREMNALSSAVTHDDTPSLEVGISRYWKCGIARLTNKDGMNFQLRPQNFDIF